jgi:hypothetical protein
MKAARRMMSSFHEVKAQASSIDLKVRSRETARGSGTKR